MKTRHRQHKSRPVEKVKRHTHRTAAGIEDALAVLIEIVMDFEALRLRAQRAMDILREVRAGPYAYDPEKPSGIRIKIRKS